MCDCAASADGTMFGVNVAGKALCIRLSSIRKLCVLRDLGEDPLHAHVQR